MADKTIAALTDGATAHLTDKIYASRDPFDASGDVWICPQYIRDMLRGSEHTWTKTQTIALGTITDPANILALTATWNDAADTFDAIDVNITDTASATTSRIINLRVGGTSQFSVARTGILTARSTCNLGTNSGASTIFGQNVVCWGEAANVFAQRNGTSAQAFRVYNTYTDASNYERSIVSWVSNNLKIGTENAGTGSARGMVFVTAGLDRWTVSSAGHLLANTDNTYDIGADGATRPRRAYIAGFAMSPAYYIQNRGQIQGGGADGKFQFTNLAGTDFGMLMFGGTTSSFPALKRNSAALQARLADDSAFAVIQGALQTDANAVAETPTATHTLTIKDASGTAYKVLAVAA